MRGARYPSAVAQLGIPPSAEMLTRNSRVGEIHVTALLNVNVSDWLHEAAERALSPEMLEMLVLQLGVIAAMFAVALMLRLGTRGLTDRVAARALHYIPAAIRISALGRIVTLAYTWLLLVITERVLARSGLDPTLVGIAATLSALWIVLRASTALLRDALFARFVAPSARKADCNGRIRLFRLARRHY